MEFIDCILCNTNDTRLLVKKNSFNVVQCKGCDLVYLNPRLNGTELADLYNLTQDSNVESISISQKDAEHDKHKIKKFKIAIRLLKKHKKDIQNIFDLGCSTGIFLGMVAKEGWTPYGSDVNSNLVNINRKRFNDNIRLQIGDSIDFPDRHFDVVTLFDSIEHMPNPITTLKEVARVVKDDGFVVISTPNIEGLFPRLTYVILGKTIGVWEHPTPPGHVFQFSLKTLKMVLKKAGLEIVVSENFEIYMPYTVGELENSIINALRMNNKNNGDSNRESWPNGITKLDHKKKSLNFLSKLKKLPRLLIHGFCWGLVTAIYPLARILRKGDSMVVIAKKITI